MKKYKKMFVYKQLAMNLYKNTPQLLSRLLLELTHDAEIEMPLINQLHKDVYHATKDYCYSSGHVPDWTSLSIRQQLRPLCVHAVMGLGTLNQRYTRRVDTRRSKTVIQP